MRSGSTRARSAAPARACWCRRASRSASSSKLRARMDKLRVGDPLDKVDRHRRDRRAGPAGDASSGLVEQGATRARPCWQPSWACPTEGCFYPPTLFTDVAPAATIAQEEIFGPVLVAMTFRTPAEAVALANNTRYGLAASVWSENINLALDIAPQIKAGVVWVNCTNLFDAAAGFGGYRESGFGREGGREGLFEYAQADCGERSADAVSRLPIAVENATSMATVDESLTQSSALPPIDRTAKLYIGGKQARPDGGYSRPVCGAHGRLVGEVGDGNRKDIRNAVEAARAAGRLGRADRA